MSASNKITIESASSGRLSDVLQMTNSKNKDRKVHKLSLDDIEVREQVRTSFEGIQELAESIKSVGLMQPIIVHQHEEIAGRYVLISGERRLRAHRHADLFTIDALIADKPTDPVQLAVLQVTENLKRKDLTPMELAKTYEIVFNKGFKQREIGKMFGVTPAHVSLHLSMLNLPESIQLLEQKGRVKDAESISNLKQAYELYPSIINNLSKKLLETKEEIFSRKESREMLARAKLLKEKMALKREGASQITAAPIQAKQAQEKDDIAQIGSEVVSRPSKDVDSKKKRTTTVEEFKSDIIEADSTEHIDDAAMFEAMDINFVEPKAYSVHVNVLDTANGETVASKGVLMNNRISKDPERAWVKYEDGNEGTVPVTALSIIGVGKK